MCISRSGLIFSAIVENPWMSQNRMRRLDHLAVAGLDRPLRASDVARHLGGDEAGEFAGDRRIGHRLRQQPPRPDDGERQHRR